MKIKYKQWAYVYFFGFFTLFAGLILLIVVNRSKELKTEIIKSDLIVYAEIVDKCIVENHLYPEQMESLTSVLFYFPDSLRLTVLNEEGVVLFDNSGLEKKRIEEDIMQKVEVAKALIYGDGWSIRESISMNNECLFYAIYENNYIIRIALPYTKETELFLKPDLTLFTSIAILMFFIFLSPYLFYLYFKGSVYKLKQFVLSFDNDNLFSSNMPPFDNGLDEIGYMTERLFDQLNTNKKNTLLEREKLIDHFHFSEVGISFFTPFFKNIYTNSHFVQYLNILLNEPTLDVNSLFQSPVFSEILQFVENPEEENTLKSRLHGNGHSFFVRVIIFEDKSFEIILRDISEKEKNRLERNEMTNNIAHELRTPITSMRGCLETLIKHETLSAEKKKEFIERAYNQTIRLSEIIQDISLLSKTVDAPQHFEKKEIDLYEMLQQLIIDSKKICKKNNSTIVLQVDKDVIVKGNHTLLYSIFWNLTNNALRYAGEEISIFIHKYMEDDGYYYFSFSDNGKGMEEEYLSHIFERFYRIAEGRTRDKGGSGLGLSIVKNAVEFHNGEISAKNRTGGGLEFLFTLRKS